jgi:AcrR family transcriptional regulator
VSPRPAPSRHDATARQFLRAAVQLIDAYLDDQPLPARPARLRSIRFPAALDWLRTEDVIRLAAADGTSGVSRKAFFNRWPTRDEFLPDALVYALVYDEVPEDPKDLAKQMPPEATGAASLSEAVCDIAEDVLASLRRHPRSYLTLHIGPLLPQHPALWNALIPSMQDGNKVWADSFATLVDDLGLALRPGWTAHRLALALQAALDGFLLRYRIQPGDFASSRWEGAGIFADTVIAIVLGIVDAERTGESGRAVLDRLGARRHEEDHDADPAV